MYLSQITHCTFLSDFHKIIHCVVEPIYLILVVTLIGIMVSSPKFELIYFDGAGRAEAIRIMFHAAGVDFTDTRFSFKDWPEVKPTTPLGFVPVLKIDDQPHCQTLALMRYAAKKAGFYPADALEALVVDEVADTLNDLMSATPRVSQLGFTDMVSPCRTISSLQRFAILVL